MHLRLSHRTRTAHTMQQNSLEKPLLVYIQQNQVLLLLVMGCRTLLRESSDSPTWCRELVGGWPDYIDVCDPFSHGMGGIIFGKHEARVPTMFWWEWSHDVTNLYQSRSITNSDLKLAGLLFTWLVMELVCGDLQAKRVTLFSKNLPTVGWVGQLATCWSLVSAHLIRAIVLRLKLKGNCPMRVRRTQ